ncbi:MAG: hypothetical protein Q9169_006383 [Polycauliona sp. 2 TL-2023]
MSKPTYYFAYGSNLCLKQMAERCPTSQYIGMARLPHHRWIINRRGYANIVPTVFNASDIVYGLVYSLTPEDEEELDFREGVPWAYTKEMTCVDVWESDDGGKVDWDQTPERRRLLVYIDRKRTDEGTPHAEYVRRINMGVVDALEKGMPVGYVEDVIRKFLPVEKDEE